MDITTLDKEGILAIDPMMFTGRFISKDEIVHICDVFDCWWKFDYQLASELIGEGKRLFHAILKGKKHSDGFINLKELLKIDVLCELFARQLVRKFDLFYNKNMIEEPDFVFGVPTAASGMARKVADLMGVEYVHIEKDDETKKMFIAEEERAKLKPWFMGMGIEDLCTEGTGVTEAYELLLGLEPENVDMIRRIFYIFNRGGKPGLLIKGHSYIIDPLAEHLFPRWEPDKCKLCSDFRSEPITAKNPPENWHKLVNYETVPGSP